MTAAFRTVRGWHGPLEGIAMEPTTARATTASASRPLKPSARAARLWATVYFVLAAVGLIGTWYYNLQYEGGNYLADWFANPASSSAAVDIIVIVFVASVLYLREGARLGWRWPLLVLLIPLSALVAVCFALPLFLGLRELRLARGDQPGASSP